jgi:hypothetical protein
VRNLVMGAVAVAAAAYTFRRMGSSLGERAMRQGETMFESMPDQFPPKRMMRGIDAIREQNTRILRLLEAEEQRHAFAGDWGSGSLPEMATNADVS